MQPPDNSRTVLTYCQGDASRFWAIDSHDELGWMEAREWGYKVLHWQALPDVPEHLGG